MKEFIKFIRNATLILLLQLAFGQVSYAVSCADAPSSLAFERCSEARASDYSGSSSGFINGLGGAFEEGFNESSRVLAEMKSRGELNWAENIVMFIFYSLFIGFITAFPKTDKIRNILGLVLFIPFAIRFWEFDYIMVVLVFLFSINMIVFYSLEDEKDKKKWKEEREEADRNCYSSDEKWPYFSPINDIFLGRKSDLIKYAKKNDVIVKKRDTIDEILDKLAPLSQEYLLANLSKPDLIKYAKCGYYDINKDVMVSGVMRADFELSKEELIKDKALIKALTKAQIIEKILQNKGRQEKKTYRKRITGEEFEKELLESLEAILSEYPKLGKSELVDKLERCDSKFLNGLDLNYKKTDDKEVLLKKILTYELNICTKERLIRLTDKQDILIKSRDTKAQIIEKIIQLKG